MSNVAGFKYQENAIPKDGSCGDHITPFMSNTSRDDEHSNRTEDDTHAQLNAQAISAVQLQQLPNNKS